MKWTDRVRTRGALQPLSRYMAVRVHDGTLGPDRALGPGGAIVPWAETSETILGASALAEKGKRAEKVGEEAAIALLNDIESGATIDARAADQVLVYAAMASGPSEFLAREVTEHMKTMMWLLGSFLGTQFNIASLGVLSRVSITPAGSSPLR